jgi:hypothetical protein
LPNEFYPEPKKAGEGPRLKDMRIRDAKVASDMRRLELALNATVADLAAGEEAVAKAHLTDRNAYLDSLNADYGFTRGSFQWSRVNGFLANRPYGQFCFEIGPKGEVSRLAGISTLNRYRMTVSGPGVTPDVRVVFDGPPSPYDPYWQLTMSEIQRQVVGDVNANCGNPPPPTF